MKLGLFFLFLVAFAGAQVFFEIERQTLTSGPIVVENFGEECSIDGDISAIGASNANGGAGVVYVFQFFDSTWELAQNLTASDSGENDARNDEFGGSVSVDGDFLVVGAEGADQAYLYQRNGDSWEEILILIGSGGTIQNQGFGGKVFIDDDIIAVGAASWNGVGAVFVFDQNVPTDFENRNWGQIAQIGSPSPTSGDDFGSSVYMDDNHLFVGAPGELSDTGAVYVYGRNVGGDDSWGLVTRLSPDDAFVGLNFGVSVAASNGVLVVGAPTDGGAFNNLTGRVYIFYQNLGGTDNWGELKFITAADGEGINDFGGAVDVSFDGNTIFVGARNDDAGMTPNAGAVFLYDRNESTESDDDEDDLLDDDNDLDNWGTIGRIRAPGATATLGSTNFGDCVSISQDDDLLVGAGGFSNNAGIAFVYSVRFHSSANILSSFLLSFLEFLF